VFHDLHIFYILGRNHGLQHAILWTKNTIILYQKKWIHIKLVKYDSNITSINCMCSNHIIQFAFIALKHFKFMRYHCNIQSYKTCCFLLSSLQKIILLITRIALMNIKRLT
jgi:hypothetical protein